MARMAAVTSFFLSFRRHPLTRGKPRGYPGLLKGGCFQAPGVIAGTSTRGRSQMQVR
jgi:hypothetical protein